jgi:NAD(P)-dependent dehydrogenase (short-subunit alcohol dehydrogenase family)
MSGITSVAVGLGCAAALEFAAFGALIAHSRRLRRRERQLEQLWDRHRRAVERDVTYLHEWQDFLASYAGDVSEDERG